MSDAVEIVVDGIIYELQSQGGISRIFREVLPGICDIDPGIQVTLLTQGRLAQGLPAHPRILSRPIVPFMEKYKGSFVSPILRWAARKFVSAVGFKGKKIWHSTYYTLPLNWSGPTVITVADMVHEKFPRLFKGGPDDQFRARKRRCIERADAVICISQTTKEDIQQLYGIKRLNLHVVPLACSDIFKELSQKELSSGAPVDGPFLLYVGGRAHYKNFETLIEAYGRWPKHKDISLVAVGSPWSEEETKKLSRSGLLERVHVMSGVDDRALCCLYNRALAFVYPSLYEGFGIPLLEAMACGCPVVASRIPSTIEIAGKHPIYFDPVQTDELTRALDQAVAEGRESRRTLEGLEWSRTYSWAKTAAGTLDVYRNLLQERVS
jgi:glycosyltransferase involved in cell wall biosynthesis